MARAPHPTLVAFLRRYVLALGTAIVVLVMSIVAVNVAIDQKINSIAVVKNLKVTEVQNPGDPANYLLIGSDSRDFVGDDPELKASFGNNTTDAGGQRSDTLLIVHVDPKNKKALLVSFPRDLLVTIPGHGKSKINAAYNYGNAQLVIDTIQTNFNIPINHYMEVGFLGFGGIVDAIGGVEMYVPAPARDIESGLEIGHFGPGCYTFHGDVALQYVRSRNYEEYIDGKWTKDLSAPDLQRIDRQQFFLKRLAATAVGKAGKSLSVANKISGQVLDNLQVDPSFGRDDVNRLARAFRNIDVNDPNSVEMTTIPVKDGGNVNGVGRVLLLDQPGADQTLARLRNFDAPLAPPEIQPREVRVRVFNGSGVKGAAANASQALVARGFQYGGVGDSPSAKNLTEIRYRSGSEAKAQLVQSYLGGVGTRVQDDSIVEADVLLVIGKNFVGVASPGDTPSTTAPTTTTRPANGSGTTTTTTLPKTNSQTTC